MKCSGVECGVGVVVAVVVAVVVVISVVEWSGVEWSVVQCSVLVLVETATKLHVLLTFDKVHNPLRLLRKTTTKRPKVVRTPSVFYTFDFEMCFALRATMASTFSTSQLAKVL